VFRENNDTHTLTYTHAHIDAAAGIKLRRLADTANAASSAAADASGTDRGGIDESSAAGHSPYAGK